MGKLHTFVHLLRHDRGALAAAAANNLTRCPLARALPDEAYLKLLYRLYIGKKLETRNPETFNEKLQWLKLHDRKPEYARMVDKLLVKDYITEKLGEGYVIPTLAVWDRAEDIDFDALPDQFVLKCSHDSGSTLVCRDKNTFNRENARDILNKAMNREFFWFGREWPYRDVRPKIMAERFMQDPETRELRDYKFFCFGGKVRCFKVDFDRFTEHRANYYSPEGELLQIGEAVCPPNFNKQIRLPSGLPEMIRLAEQLSAGLPFLRVDFYQAEQQILFGELTFYPAAGFGRFTDEKWDQLLGQWLILPKQ